MTKESFINEVRNLMKLYTKGFAIDDLIGGCNTTEGFIGECLDGYGMLLLNVVAGDNEVAPLTNDYFWNMVISEPDTVTDEEIESLYDELTDPSEYKEEP